MRKYLLVILMFIGFASYAQDTIVRNFTATVSFSGMALYSAGKYQGTILVNDQSGKYKADSVKVGDLVYTSSYNSYVVDTVISKTFTSATIRLRQTAGIAAIPSGIGYISRPSTNYGMPFFTPDNQNGITSQLQAVAMSTLVHNVDSLMKYSGTGNVSDNIIPIGNGMGGLEDSGLADSSGVLHINRTSTTPVRVEPNSIVFDTKNSDGSNVKSIPYDTINDYWAYRGLIDWRSTKTDNTQRAVARIAAYDIDSTGNNLFGRIDIGTGHNGTSFGGPQVIVASRAQNEKQVFLGDGYVSGSLWRDTSFLNPMVTIAGTYTRERDMLRAQMVGNGNKILFSVRQPDGVTKINGRTLINSSGENLNTTEPSFTLDVLSPDQVVSRFLRNGNGQGNIVIGNTFNQGSEVFNSNMAAIRISSIYRDGTDSIYRQSAGLLAIRFQKASGWVDASVHSSASDSLTYYTKITTRNTDSGYGAFTIYPTKITEATAVAQRLNVKNGGDGILPIYGDTVSLGATGLVYFNNNLRIAGSPLAYSGLNSDINNSPLFVKQTGFANTTFMREGGASGITLTSINGTAASPTKVTGRFGVINTQYYHTGQFRQAIPIEFYADSLSTGFKTGIVFKNDTDNGAMSIRDGKVLIGGSDYSDLSLKISATDAIKIPSGTTSQRPNLTYAGMVRYNSDSTLTEYYNGSKWIQMQPSIKTSTELQVTGDTLISLAQQGANVGQTLVWNGSTWSPSSPIPSTRSHSNTLITNNNEISFRVNYVGEMPSFFCSKLSTGVYKVSFTETNPDVKKIDIIGNNGVLSGTNDLTIVIENPVYEPYTPYQGNTDFFYNVSLYDIATGALIDQHDTGTNHTQVASNNTITITFPGMNLFGSTGYKIVLR